MLLYLPQIYPKNNTNCPDFYIRFHMPITEGSKYKREKVAAILINLGLRHRSAINSALRIIFLSNMMSSSKSAADQ